MIHINIPEVYMRKQYTRFVRDMDLQQRDSNDSVKNRLLSSKPGAGRWNPPTPGLYINQTKEIMCITGGGEMRMYGYLREPYICNSTKKVYKVMIHEIDKVSVYTYYYTDRDAVFSSYDSFNENLETALEEFEGELDDRGWIMIEDPLPYCQHDSVLPIRVKGRETGHPQWGSYEIFSEGQWVEYNPFKNTP